MRTVSRPAPSSTSSNEAGLLTFPELPHEILWSDMREQVCTRRDAIRLEEGFREWVQDPLALTTDPVVAIASGAL